MIDKTTLMIAIKNSVKIAKHGRLVKGEYGNMVYFLSYYIPSKYPTVSYHPEEREFFIRFFKNDDGVEFSMQYKEQDDTIRIYNHEEYKTIDTINDVSKLTNSESYFQQLLLGDIFLDFSEINELLKSKEILSKRIDNAIEREKLGFFKYYFSKIKSKLGIKK